ncbi:MAG: nucleotide exchange factor GrpE [Pedosphaera sp.]|nr:nucleotide exchange factor GrpE [Pedosphaera sp.]
MSESKPEETTLHPGETANSATPNTNSPETSAAPLESEELVTLKALVARGAEAQERYVRLYADFENFKKRASRERDDVRRSAIESVIGRILPVLDTFEMAMQAATQPGVNLDTLKAGITMIQGTLRNAVSEFGVEEVNALGQTFDPLIHEAVSQVETTEAEDGQVLSQSRKGYRIKDRLIRPATVIVARRPGTTTETSSPS